MIQIVLDEHTAVAGWVQQKIPLLRDKDLEKHLGPFVAIGIQSQEKPLAGAIFHNFRTHDIEVTFAAEPGGLATRSVIRAILSYPFLQLETVRLTAITGRKNKDARTLLKRLGFKEEGIARRAFDGKEDAVIYGLLREEANKKWFPHDQWQKPKVQASKSNPEPVPHALRPADANGGVSSPPMVARALHGRPDAPQPSREGPSPMVGGSNQPWWAVGVGVVEEPSGQTRAKNGRA